MFLDVIKKVVKKTYNSLNVVEISKKRLINNYKYLSSINKNIKVAPVLKSNAYGHGIIEVGVVLDKLNPVFFCVDSIYEAYQLFNAKMKTPILITGFVDPNNLKAKRLPFSYAVFDLEQFRGILKNQPQANVHLFVDTGMHREGLRIDELESFLKGLSPKEKQRIIGLMSHLAFSESPKNPDTKKQITQFRSAVQILKKYLIYPKWIHFGNSSGLLNNKQLRLSFTNVARIGLALYGISSVKSSELKPILQLITHVIQVKKIKKGEKVGYDFTYEAKNDGLIAVLPIGYNDGVDRKLSGRGIVLIKNKQCQIIGRVSMNLCVVDANNVENIKIGDEVVVFSKDDGENNVVNSAKKAGVIPYEILVHLERSTKRKII
ncbi:MAG: alanine racemase [Patescibacteria group bacterium]